MQKAVELFNDVVYAIVILAILLIAAAFIVAPDRRRIAIWVGLSAAGFLVAFRSIARISGRQVVKQIVIPVNREATQAVIDRVLASYLAVTLIALLIGLVVAIIAFFAGPGRYAVATREWVTSSSTLREHAGAAADGRVGARPRVPAPRVAHVRQVLPRGPGRRRARVRPLAAPQRRRRRSTHLSGSAACDSFRRSP